MKTLNDGTSRNRTLTIPLREGQSVQVEVRNGRTTQPNHVADIMTAVPGNRWMVVAESMKNLPDDIVLHRSGGLGDVMLMTPIVRIIHERYGKKVHMVTGDRNVAIFYGNPHVASCSSAWPPYDEDNPPIEFDLSVENTEGNGIFIHRVDAFARLIDESVTEDERHPDYYMAQEENTWGCERLMQAFSGVSHKGVIAYVWRSTTTNRNWPEHKHDAVLRELMDHGYCVVLIDGEPIGWQPQPQYKDQVLDLSHQLTLREMAAIIKASDAIITGDTGPFHLASALDAPTVAYFGAMPVEDRQTHKYLEVLKQPSEGNPNHCGNLPCKRYVCMHWRRDAVGYSPCLDIAPSAVVAAVERVILLKKVTEQGESRGDHSKDDGDRRSSEPAQGDQVPDPISDGRSDTFGNGTHAGKGTGDSKDGVVRHPARAVLGRSDKLVDGKLQPRTAVARNSRHGRPPSKL